MSWAVALNTGGRFFGEAIVAVVVDVRERRCCRCCSSSSFLSSRLIIVSAAGSRPASGKCRSLGTLLWYLLLLRFFAALGSMILE